MAEMTAALMVAYLAAEMVDLTVQCSAAQTAALRAETLADLRVAWTAVHLAEHSAGT